jgi:hypothetical protein
MDGTDAGNYSAAAEEDLKSQRTMPRLRRFNVVRLTAWYLGVSYHLLVKILSDNGASVEMRKRRLWVFSIASGRRVSCSHL